MKTLSTSSLAQQLQTLPAKVQKTLSGLYDVGHLDEAILATILDAGTLSGDVHRLPAFAVSYLFLRQKGIPVADVIHLSKLNDRRIKLSWSPARWELEHQKLSRLENLKRLQDANVRYDLSAFESYLPVRFPGYLIGGSTRLGMEGLRQRHCVASWHEKIMTGLCAIAVVFVDHTRWTVELQTSSNADHPLVVGQIRTAYNKMPSDFVRRRIREVLAIQDVDRLSIADPTHVDEDLLKENIRRLMPILRAHQVKSVLVCFAGYGDSGQIENVHFQPAIPDCLQVEILERCRTWDNGVCLSRVESKWCDIKAAVEAVVYDYLDSTQVDWYNNDGGQGEFELNMEKNVISLFVDVNIHVTETQFSETCTFDEFENAPENSVCLANS